MDKQKALIGGFGVLLIAGVAWFFGFLGGSDPAIAKLQQIGDQMSNDDLPEAQRDALRDQFRQQMQTLSDDQRREYFDSNRDRWEGRAEQRMNEFFALSKTEQQKRLDEIITRMNQPRDTQRQNSDRGQGSGDRGARGDGGGRGSMTEAQRDERSKRRLDHSSPKMRAQFAEFRRRLDERAQQRGVKLDDGGRWGFRGPRGT